ncbi:enoyl-CoA hydratase/isomerase family protein, partial [Chloroflexota bacterium]
MAEIVFTQNPNGVAKITLNRPEVRNAFNSQAIQQFSQIVSDLSEMPEVRVAIITGEGPAFCAGADLREHTNKDTRADGQQLAQGMGDALDQLEDLPIISIAVVNGPARGGGAELAVACDLRLMAAEANIAFVQTRLGLIPGWGGGQRLLRLLGYARALELFASTRVVDAREALEIGLVNAIFPSSQLNMKAQEFGEQIAANSPQAIGKIKELFHQYRNLTPHEARQNERHAFIDLWESEDRRDRFSKLYAS